MSLMLLHNALQESQVSQNDDDDKQRHSKHCKKETLTVVGIELGPSIMKPMSNRLRHSDIVGAVWISDIDSLRLHGRKLCVLTTFLLIKGVLTPIFDVHIIIQFASLLNRIPWQKFGRPATRGA